MLIIWDTASGKYTLCDGDDPSVGKRCGPGEFSAPVSVQTEVVPCIDAPYAKPESRGNRSSRIRFSVSVEFATDKEALAFANVQSKQIPDSGELQTFDEESGEFTRYLNAALTEISPVRSGRAVDVVYSFVAGNQVLEQRPSVPIGLYAIPGILNVRLVWEPAPGAATYNVYCRVAGTSILEQIGSGISTTSATHTTGDTINRVYFVESVASNGVKSIVMSAGVTAAGVTAPSEDPPGTLPTPLAPACYSGAGFVRIIWGAVQGATSYEIYEDDVLVASAITELVYDRYTTSVLHSYSIRAISANAVSERSAATWGIPA